ncbi:MAG: hypothetical protein AAGC60_16245 [Acidobacteriota bacterium]
MSGAETAEAPKTAEDTVLTCGEIGLETLAALCARYGLTLHQVDPGAEIPGSYWGAPEAGILSASTGAAVWIRDDTPVHSFLHETCHVVCMDGNRRAAFDTEAGGTDVEENAVCYLQIVLADALDGVGRARLMADMDAWGYSFRLGSTRSWFEQDAEDAHQFLRAHGLLDAADRPMFRLRA